MVQYEEEAQPRFRAFTSRRVLVIGPPGAGKGTQCAILCDRYGVNHISTGQLFRDAIEAGTPLGRAVQRYVEEGFLVPDRLALKLLVDRIRSLAEGGGTPGFLLDGVPRTINQAEALDALMTSGQIDSVLHLQVPDAIVLERSARRGRHDDVRASVRRRLEAYRRFTVPMLAWMSGTRPVFTIDGNRPIADVAASVVGCLTSMDPVAPPSLR
jgi:adenylate kinase